MSGPPVRHLLGGLFVWASLLAMAGPGAAYFTTTASGKVTAGVATINGPTGVTLVQSGTTIAVSWSAAALSTGGAVQGYYVKRSDGATVCGIPTLVTALTCTDSTVPAGTHTYSVTAVYNSWTSTSTSGSYTTLTSPTITAEPPSPSNSTSAGFGFAGGNGSSYQCQLDGGGYGACTSPLTYSGLGQGPHTFSVSAASGSSTGPATSYTWTVDTTPPTQTLSLASGASGAYLSGTTLYYRPTAAGSFKLADAVSDAGTGPASAAFPNIATSGWAHAAETVTTPAGGPYTSSTFSWTATPSTPVGYAVTGADVAGNTSSTALRFVGDSTPPSGGALTVNGTAALSPGSTSQAANSTSFIVGSRTDYTDTGSGVASSVLTVQSESLSDSTCGAPGSAGPFTSATTISGTTQPSGIVAGYCYLYTLTGTDNVGNVASISTTVVDSVVSFQVTTQVTVATAGVATSANAIVLTAIRNGVTDTAYTGATLSWSGAASGPSGTAPTLPTNPTWTAGVATFGITLVDAETATLTVTDGTRSVTLSPITVNPGPATNVAWTAVSSPAGVPTPCLFTCTYASGFGNTQTWSAQVSITDAQGNVVSNLGAGHTVLITLSGSASGRGTTTPASPASFAIPAAGPATSAAQLQYTSVAHGNYADTLTAASTGYTSAAASFSR
jgi:hypothetical protein